MKHLLLASLLLIARGASAEDVAVFAKNQIAVGSDQMTGAIPDEADARAFLDAFRASRRAPENLAVSAPLVNPPEWGKTISAATHGEIRYPKNFPHGFVCRLALAKLQPDHRYILTLNGNPKLPGNALLPTPVPGLPDERYYDFLFIETDASGNWTGNLGIFLPRGAYQPRVYVKDADDFKIVLYHDYFPFTVD